MAQLAALCAAGLVGEILSGEEGEVDAASRAGLQLELNRQEVPGGLIDPRDSRFLSFLVAGGRGATAACRADLPIIK